MKFTPEIFNRNIADEELIADIQNAAKRLSGGLLTLRQYERLGKYAKNTVINRFGSWNEALRLAGMESAKPHAKRSIHTLMLEDIKLQANLLGRDSLSQTEYNKCGKYSALQVTRRFGRWDEATRLAGLKSARSPIETEKLFEEMKRVWIIAGRQPRRTDFKKHGNYSSSTYIKRFGAWLNAIAAFLRYIETGITCDEDNSTSRKPRSATSPRKKRRVGLRVRLYIFERDRFRCCYCGRSPATHNIWLQIDHREPVSRNGGNEIDNLQTLCNECNIGKGNRIVESL